jgi:Domain of unknown function (DUF1905)
VDVGHKDTHIVIVPFDPTVVWSQHTSVRMSRQDDPRGGRGWPASGTIDGLPFEGFVGRRYGRSYLTWSPAIRTSGLINEGDEVDVTVAPRVITRKAGR